MLRVFPRERRYAELGHLLPMFHIERAVKPGVSALPLGTPSTYILVRFGHSAMPRLGTTSAGCLAKVLTLLAELHRLGCCLYYV